MKKVFLHNALFRILSPCFSGAMAYVLILLLNNNVEQITEQFLGIELALCILLAYGVQEISRSVIILSDRLNFFRKERWRLLFQLMLSSLLNLVLVSGVVYFFFLNFSGYSPNMQELLMFSSIYFVLVLMYLSLYTSHQLLYKENSRKLEREIGLKENLDLDFQKFRQEINPQLLFESFESLIVLIHGEEEQAEEFLDHLASLYRYILAAEKKELVSFKEEYQALSSFIKLFEYLPHRNLKLVQKTPIHSLVIPASLIHTLEKIIRNSITSEGYQLEIEMRENENELYLRYKKLEKLDASLQVSELSAIHDSYLVYSEKGIRITDEDGYKSIHFPLLIPIDPNQKNEHQESLISPEP
ncbi:MAG: histidine kinase [Bacteroidota bacterium]